MKPETITLSEAESEFVRARIAEGENRTASEVISESLALLEKKAQREKKRSERFFAAIEEGEKDLREGRYTEITSEAEHRAFWDDIMEEVRNAK